jgi:CDP-diacylglycerol pyrophosphatase
MDSTPSEKASIETSSLSATPIAASRMRKILLDRCHPLNRNRNNDPSPLGSVEPIRRPIQLCTIRT